MDVAQGRRPGLARLGWVLAACGAAGLVFATQVVGRGALLWDEAVRVGSGQRLSFALDPVRFGEVWDWLEAQTVYPFLQPALNGIALRLGASPVASAWIPSTFGFALLGVLSGRLIRELGGHRLAAALGTAMVWLLPINARLAAGAFTENLGAAALLGLLILLVRFVRQPSARRSIGIATVVATAWAVKYPYGILATATVIGTGATNWVHIRHVRPALLATASVALLVTAQLAVNWEQRWIDFGNYRGQPGWDSIDFGYYGRALFGERELGLEPAVAATLLVGMALLVGAWRARPETRPVVIAVVVFVCMYSVTGTKVPRIAGLILPVMVAGAITGLGDEHRRLSATPDRRPLRWLSAWCVVLLLTQLAMQSRSFDTRLGGLDENDPAAAGLAFIADHLGPTRMPLLMLGPSNELSPHAVRFAWERKLRREAAGVAILPEAAPEHRGPTFDHIISQLRPSHVVAIDIRPGSTLDTADLRVNFASSGDYVRLAREMESRGELRRIAATTLDHGRLEIVFWQPTTAAGWVEGTSTLSAAVGTVQGEH